MKIGIMTFHKAYNYGAFMQCYSLTNNIKKRFPECDIEVLDYTSLNMKKYYNRTLVQSIIGDKASNGSKPVLIILKRIVKTCLNFSRIRNDQQSRKVMHKAFESVWEELPLSNTELISDDIDEINDFIQGKYDLIIVGSDAIWNDSQTSWPNPYLLHDITGCKKMSYAASTYGMDYQSRTEEQSTYSKESLLDFKFIGARDTVTEDYVRYCTKGRAEVQHTCDPSLLLDISEVPIDIIELRKKLMNRGIAFNKPIIGLMCSSWLAKEVKRRLGEEFQYVSIYYDNGYGDVFLPDLTPFEWSRVFSLFDATFTHFFHGTMFSLLNGTMTFSIEKVNEYNSQYTTKIKDALTRMKLDKECYRVLNDITESDWKSIKRLIKTQDKQMISEKYYSAIQKERGSFERFIDVLCEEVVDGNRTKK